MKTLGYSLTYRTQCRACTEPIFFHTSGHGDAVFFDRLGSPWRIHDCYLTYYHSIPFEPGVDPGTGERIVFVADSDAIVVRKERCRELERLVADYSFAVRDETGPKSILAIRPENHLRRPLKPNPFPGRIQSLVKDRGKRLVEELDGPGRQTAEAVLRGRYSQVTVVDFEQNSYAALIDLRCHPSLTEGDIVEVELRAVEAHGVGAVFAVERMDTLIPAG